MKVFSLICVIIVLVLNFVPCADAQETLKPHTGLAPQQHADRDHAHGLTDNCTPFCHCSCCAALALTAPIYLNTVLLPETTNTTIPYRSGKYITISLPIWQPPKWSSS